MTPKTIYSNASFNKQEDPYGVSGKFTMLLGQFGGEYQLPLGSSFHSFIGVGLALAYFYNGGTDALLNSDAHAVENFDIDTRLAWYGELGASYDMSKNFSLAGFVNYTNLQPNAAYQFSSYRNGTPTREQARDELKLKINPVILSLGGSWKF